MARITVEDCLEKIPNRFQLVLAATYRARMLSQGHAPRIESRNKPARDCPARNRRRQGWPGNAQEGSWLSVFLGNALKEHRGCGAFFCPTAA